MEQIDYLIIGGGIAGTTAADLIREKDSTSSIAIITEEKQRAYSRVLLPHFLRNENSLESVFVRKPESYIEKKITLATEERVTSVDTAKKIVVTSKNREINYNKLLIASGGKVNKLPIPGGNLNEVAYLRTFEDAKKIKDLITKSRQAVVLGGGFIGIEFAQSFLRNGLKTTAVIREKYFWDTIVGENSGKLLSQILTENGVTILSEVTAIEFVGTEHLEGVKISNGNIVKADVAGVGIGIHLDLEYLKNSDLAIKKGVVTNEYLETSAPNVWAAGDIAEFYDPVLKRYHTLGNWANAAAQGRTAGMNMRGEKSVFETASMYSINIFSSNFSFLGDPAVDENTEIIERGNLSEKKLARLLIKEDIITGASLINLPIDRNAVTKLIKSKAKITAAKEKLTDLKFDLSTL